MYARVTQKWGWIAAQNGNVTTHVSRRSGADLQASYFPCQIRVVCEAKLGLVNRRQGIDGRRCYWVFVDGADGAAEEAWWWRQGDAYLRLSNCGEAMTNMRLCGRSAALTIDSLAVSAPIPPALQLRHSRASTLT
jgi:hypothetical protein